MGISGCFDRIWFVFWSNRAICISRTSTTHLFCCVGYRGNYLSETK